MQNICVRLTQSRFRKQVTIKSPNAKNQKPSESESKKSTLRFYFKLIIDFTLNINQFMCPQHILNGHAYLSAPKSLCWQYYLNEILNYIIIDS